MGVKQLEKTFFTLKNYEKAESLKKKADKLEVEELN